MRRDIDELVDQVLTLLVDDLAEPSGGTPAEQTCRKVTSVLGLITVELAEAVRELRAVLPVALANPAGTTALGELPDLRTFVVDVAEGGITCGDPNCPALGDLEVPFRRLQVSDLLQRISRHRRSCHTPGVVNTCSGGTE